MESTYESEIKIAFESTVSGNWDIFIMNFDGDNKINLTNHPGIDRSPQFSPDGSKIAFLSLRDFNYEIYLIDIVSRQQTNLTNHAADDEDFVFSSDGKHILFTSSRDGNKEIYIMDIDGSNEINLTNNLAEDIQPEISPEGDRVVYTSNRTGTRQIYIMDRYGDSEIRISDERYSEILPKFTPDGQKLIYQTYRVQGFAIYMMNLDGSEKKQLVPRPTFFNIAASRYNFSKDGNSMIFNYMGGITRQYDIYMINFSDVGSLINLTNTDDETELNAVYSCDGDYIVFDSRDKEYINYGQILRMKANGSDRINISNVPAECGIPTVR